ncbi:hypothetical protein MMC09_001236 [Bachmanniomyces sp. S44760]|nr:hypothetical protein [Bachmanniomyces sp. S44760]
MESAGLRQRQQPPKDEAALPPSTSPPETDSSLTPPHYQVDLSLLPSRRYAHVAKDFTAQFPTLPALFDDVVGAMVPQLSISHLRSLARFFLRGVYSAEETEELKGISRDSGMEMFLLVAFNVLLDLFMGCTSGGARIKEEGKDGATKMVHFRTLDWEMAPLRKIVVSLDFVTRPDGPVVASTVTYFGFVGCLTGVREGLSLSLNFRPCHDDSTRFRNFRFYAHQVLVLLGFRPSIASLLRQCLIPQAGTGEGTGHSKELGDLADVERDMPATKTTACYLIFCDGDRTVTMEKDHNTAIVRSARNFIVALNHDVDAELAPSAAEHRTGQTNGVTPNNALAALGFEDLVEESIDRKKCAVRLWEKAVRKGGLDPKKIGEAGAELYVAPEEVQSWVDDDRISNEQTHYAVIMDPKEGKIISVKRYVEPIDVRVAEYDQR